MNTNKRTKVATIPELTAEIHAMRLAAHHFAETIEEQAKRLERELKLARGTGEHAPVKKALATAPAMKPGANPYFIGDDTSTAKLSETIERCISDRPRTRAELVELTGANPNRINGVINRLQVGGAPVKNLGTKAKALWYIAAARRPYSSRTER